MVDSKAIHEYGNPVKIHLYKTAKDGYAWEIHVSGASVAGIMPVIREANHKLKREFRKTNQSKCLYTINIIIFDV